jgi:hypothetical protein
MFYVRNFIVGGYAYYRKKGFGHSGSVSMVLLSSLGFVFLILHGFLNTNGFSFFSSFKWYGYFSVFIICVLWLYINSLLCRSLKVYELDFKTSIDSKKIRLYNYVTYFLITIFIFVRVFI